jgi:hypothetical protein
MCGSWLTQGRSSEFRAALMSTMTEGHRQILADGLAREYAGLEGWMQVR